MIGSGDLQYADAGWWRALTRDFCIHGIESLESNRRVCGCGSDSVCDRGRRAMDLAFTFAGNGGISTMYGVLYFVQRKSIADDLPA